jgi:hypothetical protein
MQGVRFGGWLAQRPWGLRLQRSLEIVDTFVAPQGSPTKARQLQVVACTSDWTNRCALAGWGLRLVRLSPMISRASSCSSVGGFGRF